MAEKRKKKKVRGKTGGERKAKVDEQGRLKCEVEKLIRALMDVGSYQAFFEIKLLLDEFNLIVSRALINRAIGSWITVAGYGELPGFKGVNIASLLDYCDSPNLIATIRYENMLAQHQAPSAEFIKELLGQLDSISVNATEHDLCSALEFVFVQGPPFTDTMILDALPEGSGSLRYRPSVAGGVARFFLKRERYDALMDLSDGDLSRETSRFVFDELCRAGRMINAFVWRKNKISGKHNFTADNIADLVNAVAKREKFKANSSAHS